MDIRSGSTLLESALEDVPRFEQYLGLWAIEDLAAARLYAAIRSLDFAQHLAAHAGRPVAASHSRVIPVDGGNVAMIEIRGTMTKYGSSLSEAGSTIRGRRDLRVAARSEEVDAILLSLDTPGGTVSGTDQFANDVRLAAQAKTVHAFVSDMAASAGYYVASQATEIIADSPITQVGSIGVLLGVLDVSDAMREERIKVLRFASGSVKGAGMFGAEVTPEHMAYFQGRVDSMAARFRAVVGAGRGLSAEAVQELATGAAFSAGDAIGMGLVDGIRTLDEELAAISKSIRSGKGRTRAVGSVPADIVHAAAPPAAQEKEVESMSTEQKPQPATLEQLRASLPDAGADFLVAQLSAGATLDAAKDSWIATQKVALQAANESLEKAKQTRSGIPPIESPGTTAGTEAGEDAIDEWHAAVRDRAKEDGIPKHLAAQLIRREQPDLAQRYVDAYNAKFAAERDSKN